MLLNWYGLERLDGLASFEQYYEGLRVYTMGALHHDRWTGKFYAEKEQLNGHDELSGYHDA